MGTIDEAAYGEGASSEPCCVIVVGINDGNICGDVGDDEDAATVAAMYGDIETNDCCDEVGTNEGARRSAISRSVDSTLAPAAMAFTGLMKDGASISTPKELM